MRPPPTSATSAQHPDTSSVAAKAASTCANASFSAASTSPATNAVVRKRQLGSSAAANLAHCAPPWPSKMAMHDSAVPQGPAMCGAGSLTDRIWSSIVGRRPCSSLRPRSSEFSGPLCTANEPPSRRWACLAKAAHSFDVLKDESTASASGRLRLSETPSLPAAHTRTECTSASVPTSYRAHKPCVRGPFKPSEPSSLPTGVTSE
mmetsp:Transcript_53872/g.124003  ORF Transcript_53872/g.124003 Transcript_53872/m.124003 type:complete len:205 (+) Transcript_53872:1068-1682(+)